MTRFTLEGLRTFHAWTHSSLDALLDHLETMPEALLAEELDGFGFRSIRAQVEHLLLCELNWLGRLQARDLRPKGVQPRTVEELRSLKREAAAATASYLDGLTDEALDTQVGMHWQDGTPFAGSPALVMHHILTHAYHHKGQIVGMCRLLDHPAPDTDLFR